MHTSVLIVAGGASPAPSLLQQWAGRYDGVIAADSGIDTLIAAGIEADHVTGDFDSISDDARKKLPADCQYRNPDQQTTDLEKAICLAICLGAADIGLACVTGGRLDHSVNAVSLMLRYHDQAAFTLFDECGEARLVTPPGATLHDPAGTRVSLIPAPEATGLTSTNLRYPLDSIDLRLGGRDGVSNEITASPAQIAFHTGALLVYRQTAPHR